ncbi:MAG: hypothetical protein OQL16_00650 [Gammaproteobacteria bacterium]|nr:hypothetical protein [Gammaproteobacteria bacterium]
MIRRRGYFTDPFTDLLFNALLGFTMLFMVTIMFVNPLAKLGSANLKAEFIITLSWPEDLPDDLDVWVEDPHGEVVSYLQKDAGWLHLDRDDRGEINDTILINGQEVVHRINQEVVTLRGIISGEYIVNAYFYEARSNQPIDVMLTVDKVNPTLQTVFVDKITMLKQDEEHTFVRFKLNGKGEIQEINRLPKRLTPYALEPS